MKALIPLLALLLAAPSAQPGMPEEIDVFFEVKLLVRDRAWGRAVQVDQWSAGRLRMKGSATTDGAVVYRISEVLESPWTFRWYPTRDEVKLGAAVWVEHPEGHPYGALARQLEATAAAKFDLWWDQDPVTPGPSWAQDNGGFWARQHREELDEKDPLPEHSTFPFHVLGRLNGRFGFTLRDGAVETVVERMSSPWLPNGWSDAAGGEQVQGYGCWERKRPRWEPRTYETFAAAITLLGPSESVADPLGDVMRVLSAMQPLAARVGSKAVGEPRVWRQRAKGSDEVQILVGEDDRFKAWVRVGYRAVAPRTP